MYDFDIFQLIVSFLFIYGVLLIFMKRVKELKQNQTKIL